MPKIDELKRLYAYLQDCDEKSALEEETVALQQLQKMLGLEGLGLSVSELLTAAEQTMEGESDLPEP